MLVKFFAYLRDYTGCKTVDFPHHETVRALGESLCARYGDQLRAKMFSPDGADLGEEIIIMVNGRRVEHEQGLDTPLSPDDTVAIFPVVAGG